MDVTEMTAPVRQRELQELRHQGRLWLLETLKTQRSGLCFPRHWCAWSMRGMCDVRVAEAGSLRGSGKAGCQSMQFLFENESPKDFISNQRAHVSSISKVQGHWWRMKFTLAT